MNAFPPESADKTLEKYCVDGEKTIMWSYCPSSYEIFVLMFVSCQNGWITDE